VLIHGREFVHLCIEIKGGSINDEDNRRAIQVGGQDLLL
jgi:hypothetical protein